MCCCSNEVRHMGHCFTCVPHVRHNAEWPHNVMTESMTFSMQITHSFCFLVTLVFDGLAIPHERQTTREPKFTSGHDEHCQSPGLIVSNGFVSITIGSTFDRLHL
jgi:hypothetical protein